MFDGPVDALWIESMNTVLDEGQPIPIIFDWVIFRKECRRPPEMALTEVVTPFFSFLHHLSHTQ